MSASRAFVSAAPLDVAALEAQVASDSCGAVLTFVGTVRDNFDGRPVSGLDYEVYAEMAVPVMEQICGEVAAQWPGARVVIAHRTGHLDLGEASVVIAVAAPHRGAAYDASRYAIEALKDRVPIWKKELYSDGSTWKANAGPHLPSEDAP
jgi:MoaE-MoaD fusion protein